MGSPRHPVCIKDKPVTKAIRACNIPDVPGSYVLVIEMPRKDQITVGALGAITFRSGFYIYAGSAMGGLRRRVTHHLQTAPKPYWHVDYLLAEARITAILLYPATKRLECTIARTLSEQLEPVPHFGASDCRCSTHLYHASSTAALRSALTAVQDIAQGIQIHLRATEK